MIKTESISSAAFLLAGSVLLSRVLGYVREMLLAYTFGASETTDAFYAAFQIPDLMNYFLAGGALSMVFIPLYNRLQANEGQKAADDLMAEVLGTMGVIVTAATALLWIYAEPITHLQFPNFSDTATQTTVHLTRLVLPAQIFFITGGIIQGALLAHKHFLSSALSPLIYNACIILGGWFLHPLFGIDGFAIGTLAGAFLGPFLMPVLFARKHIPLRCVFRPFDKKFATYFLMAAPLMCGQTLLTLDEWYGRWFGALLSSGTVSYLSYARRLMQVPIAVMGQAVAAAALPTLSKLWAEKRVDDMNRTLQQTLETGLALAIITAGGFLALAQPLVTLVYQHGHFTADDAERVAGLFILFCFAIPSSITQQITLRTFYARGDTWRPMALGTVIALSAIPFYLWMSKQFGAEGLPMAGATALTFNALATLVFARFIHKAPLLAPLFVAFLRAGVIATLALAGSIGGLMLREHLAGSSVADAKAGALLSLVFGGAGYGLVAVLGIWLLGPAGVRDYLLKIIRRISGSGQSKT